MSYNPQSSKGNAKQVLYGLISAYKKRNLYAPSHSVYQDALHHFKTQLDDHIAQHGNFRIHIERMTILDQDELLYEGEAEPTDIAFLLHRDGILWLEFQDGIEIWEIDTFLTILHDHCVLDEDPEDDIVTALWEVQFASILYEAADLELGFQEIDVTQLPCVSGNDADADAQDQAQDQNISQYSESATNVLMYNGHEKLWTLTPREQDQLRNMIATEKELDGSDNVVEALLYILEKHCLEEDITELLDTLRQELTEALINARFSYLLKVIERLKRNMSNISRGNQWLSPYLAQFFTDLGSESFLSGLQHVCKRNQKLGNAQVKQLKQFLLHLDKSIIDVIAPMMLTIQSGQLQRIILEVIGTIAMSDYLLLEKLIKKADSNLAARLVFILGHLKDSRSRQTLSELLGDPSTTIRKSALTAVLTRDDQAVGEIFPLIDDSDEQIRKLVFKRISREKSESVENALLNYLSKKGASNINDQPLVETCIALGRCGSDRSIPCLTQLLFKWPHLGVLRSGNSFQRKAAVAGLIALGTPRATWLIGRNNRGFFSNIFRSAVSNST